MKEIVLIGSTGSIGRQTLSVLRRYPDRFRLAALVANENAEEFLLQVKEFHPRYAALVSEEAGKRIKEEIPQGVDFSYGEQAALAAVSYGDTVLVAATGFKGLAYSLRAIQEKKALALANKETLVCGGELVMNEVKKNGVSLAPVDSEHSALFQALSFHRDAPFQKLIITASGGPFYSYSKEQLALVTAKDALKHPTWQMGAKITIDSATLLNKGFEVIEAMWLYSAPLSKIQTVVQPESIVHSLVEFEDGAVMAQMSYPTMELPIQLALTYPDRLPTSVKPLDLVSLGAIRFLPLERKRFPCYDLALSAIERGDNAPCALNAAGEVAVNAFLKGRISFLAIGNTIEETLSRLQTKKVTSFEDLLETDRLARRNAELFLAKHS